MYTYIYVYVCIYMYVYIYNGLSYIYLYIYISIFYLFIFIFINNQYRRSPNLLKKCLHEIYFASAFHFPLSVLGFSKILLLLLLLGLYRKKVMIVRSRFISTDVIEYVSVLYSLHLYTKYTPIAPICG